MSDIWCHSKSIVTSGSLEMSLLKLILKLGIIGFLVDYTIGGVTEEQMLATGKLMRDVCFPKFPKVSIDVADNIKKGVIPDDKDVKCYINCILEMMQTIKKGKFLLESSLKQVDIILPDEYKEQYFVGIRKCKDAANGIKNHCDAAYALIKCLHEAIPRFIFP